MFKVVSLFLYQEHFINKALKISKLRWKIAPEDWWAFDCVSRYMFPDHRVFMLLNAEVEVRLVYPI